MTNKLFSPLENEMKTVILNDVNGFSVSFFRLMKDEPQDRLSMSRYPVIYYFAWGLDKKDFSHYKEILDYKGEFCCNAQSVRSNYKLYYYEYTKKARYPFLFRKKDFKDKTSVPFYTIKGQLFKFKPEDFLEFRKYRKSYEDDLTMGNIQLVTPTFSQNGVKNKFYVTALSFFNTSAIFEDVEFSLSDLEEASVVELVGHYKWQVYRLDDNSGVTM
jgi:hypothetical protein